MLVLREKSEWGICEIQIVVDAKIARCSRVVIDCLLVFQK